MDIQNIRVWVFIKATILQFFHEILGKKESAMVLLSNGDYPLVEAPSWKLKFWFYPDSDVVMSDISIFGPENNVKMVQVSWVVNEEQDGGPVVPLMWAGELSATLMLHAVTGYSTVNIGDNLHPQVAELELDTDRAVEAGKKFPSLARHYTDGNYDIDVDESHSTIGQFFVFTIRVYRKQ